MPFLLGSRLYSHLKPDRCHSLSQRTIRTRASAQGVRPFVRLFKWRARNTAAPSPNGRLQEGAGACLVHLSRARLNNWVPQYGFQNERALGMTEAMDESPGENEVERDRICPVAMQYVEPEWATGYTTIRCASTLISLSIIINKAK